jgi:hypothetical protein
VRSLGFTIQGLRRAAREPRLAAILWLAHLLLAAAAIAPVAVVLTGALEHSPRGDLLIERIRIEPLVDLLRQTPALGATLRPALAAMLAIGLIGNALLAGGALEALLARDAQPVGHRFGRGAGRFAGRFLRAGVAAVAVGAVAAAVAAAPFQVVRKAFEESVRAEAELVRVLARLAAFAAAALAFAMVLVALDLARVRTVRDDRRDTVRLFLRALATLARRPLLLFGVWGWNALARGLLIAAGAALGAALPVATWAGIVALFLLHQGAFYLRAGLRVALWSSEIALVDALDRRAS